MPSLFLDTERMSNLTSGLGQVCLHLGQELVRQQPPGWELTFLVPKNLVGVFGPSAKYIVASRWRRVIHPWTFDVWHSLYQGSRFLPQRKSKLVYTVLDLNYLSMPDYSDARKAKQKQRYQRAIDQATVVTTISAYVARDVKHQLVVPPATPVEVIYCGVNTHASMPAQPPSIKPDKPFLYFIGMLQFYKNVHAMLPILKAFPEYQLVLAGPDKPAYNQQIRKQAQQLGVIDRVLIPGPVDEATKWWLYANCEAFLFPSRLEGFGIPVVEAMSFGKPVFSSSLTSLPEVGGDEAFYFPDFDPDTVVEVFRSGMATYRNDPAMPDRLRAQSQKFSWAVVAADYWKLYQRILTS
jgi:glycosyltransferase involved in cell wall biosynthesis